MARKILIIVENLPVPFDSRVWKEARALYEGGYHVSVLCPQGKGYRRSYECMDGIHIFRHPMPAERDSVFGYLVEFSAALFWQFLYSWWIFLRKGFDLIQGCNPPDNIFLIALPFRLFGVKYIFDHHDANPELYLAKYGREDLLYHIQVCLERWSHRCSDVVMATNESYRQLAISRGRRSPEDVFVVRNGPDLDTFRNTRPIPDLKYGKTFLVGYVGTMSVQEGLDILIEAASLMKSQGRRDVHFTCIGGGPGLAELRNMVTACNLDDTINFTGRIPDWHLLEILSTADVCVNPDKPCAMNDISTMIKIMEYMALGKPIVQFDLREGRFSAGDASLYSNTSGDLVANFAGDIVWLLDQPEERRRMGAYGLKRIQSELAWRYSVNHLLNAYERAFNKSTRRRYIEAASIHPDARL